MTYKPDVSVGSDLHYMGILALKEKLRAMDRVDIIYDFDYELFDSENYDLVTNNVCDLGLQSIIYKNVILKLLTISITFLESGDSNISINVKINKEELDNWVENNDIEKNYELDRKE